VLSSQGSSETSYAFTGEQYDPQTGLVYLRARYYSTASGRFMSRDAWVGDKGMPMSYNAWLYGYGNPVIFTDPSGRIAQGIDEKKAETYKRLLEAAYNVVIYKDWGVMIVTDSYSPYYGYDCYWNEGAWHNAEEIVTVYNSVKLMATVMSGNKFRSAMRRVVISRWDNDQIRSWAPPPPLSLALGDIILTDYVFLDPNVKVKNDMFETYTVIHEFGHVWDYRTGLNLSSGLSKELGTIVCDLNEENIGKCHFDISAGKEKPPGNPGDNYAGTHPIEDWAEAFATYIYPQYYLSFERYDSLGPLRWSYVDEQIKKIN